MCANRGQMSASGVSSSTNLSAVICLPSDVQGSCASARPLSPTRKSTGSPIKKRSGYLPTLDGWRALAVLAIILHHDSVHSFGIFSTRPLYDYGSCGVDIFFAISGFLICSRLLEEERINGFVHVRRFYVRRFFRILPPALFYLLVIALLARMSIIAVTTREWLEGLLFCRNYPTILGGGLSQPGWYTAHFWSLSLEEQFYLILPAFIVLCARRYRIALLICLAVLISLHRISALHSRPWTHIEFHADVRLDALLVPALFAVLASDPKARQVLQRVFRLWPLLVLATACLIPFGKGTGWQTSALALLMPCIIVGSVLNPTNLFGEVLEWTPVRYFGRISFSIYLWQQLFFNHHFNMGGPARAWQMWPLNWAFTLTCAILSYYVLERPLARLGHRWAPSATPGREDLDGDVDQDERICVAERLPDAPPRPMYTGDES
jgi:peptidoglycan/LPS O-acetylase OafA/YrhL